MKRMTFCLMITALLVAAPSQCFAFESIEFVTKERAKELGMEIKVGPAGPEAVLIVLDFETKGELKSYYRVALDMHDEGRLLLSSTLKEDKAPPGHIVVSFAADRKKLDRIEVKVVTMSGGQRTGHVLRMKEFVALDKLDKVP